RPRVPSTRVRTLPLPDDVAAALERTVDSIADFRPRPRVGSSMARRKDSRSHRKHSRSCRKHSSSDRWPQKRPSGSGRIDCEHMSTAQTQPRPPKLLTIARLDELRGDGPHAVTVDGVDLAVARTPSGWRAFEG